MQWEVTFLEKKKGCEEMIFSYNLKGMCHVNDTNYRLVNLNCNCQQWYRLLLFFLHVMFQSFHVNFIGPDCLS